MADIHPVYDVVQHIQNLRHRHGDRHGHDIARYAPLPEVIFLSFHVLIPVLILSIPVSIADLVRVFSGLFKDDQRFLHGDPGFSAFHRFQ